MPWLNRSLKSRQVSPWANGAGGVGMRAEAKGSGSAVRSRPMTGREVGVEGIRIETPEVAKACQFVVASSRTSVGDGAVASVSRVTTKS